jgi:hypothetical protein
MTVQEKKAFVDAMRHSTNDESTVYKWLCLLMAEREECGQGLVRQPKVDSLRVAHSSRRRRRVDVSVGKYGPELCFGVSISFSVHGCIM